jgi:hypothetical protein
LPAGSCRFTIISCYLLNSRHVLASRPPRGKDQTRCQEPLEIDRDEFAEAANQV